MEDPSETENGGSSGAAGASEVFAAPALDGAMSRSDRSSRSRSELNLAAVVASSCCIAIGGVINPK